MSLNVSISDTKNRKGGIVMAELGNIKIANEVVAIIAGTAAVDVEGVYSLTGGVVDDITKLISKKNLTKGVKVDIGEDECSVDIYVKVEFGSKIPEVAANIQGNVIKAISEMTGLKVMEVNILVQGVQMPEEQSVEKEEAELVEAEEV